MAIIVSPTIAPFFGRHMIEVEKPYIISSKVEVGCFVWARMNRSGHTVYRLLDDKHEWADGVCILRASTFKLQIAQTKMALLPRRR